MKILLTVLLVLTILFPSNAQKVDLSKLKAIKARNIGPGGMSGRITAIDVVLSNPAIMYVGAASGGLWKSNDAGVTWNPIFDKQDVQSIGSIAIDQNNPDLIWVGTGEGNPRNSQNMGLGIYKSIDGGKTFKKMGLEKSRAIHRIIIDKNNSNIVYAGVQGTAFGDSEERGVFKTTDAGKTWKKILYVAPNVGIADMIVDPINPNKIIASMWEFRREPWIFKSGGKGSGLYLTYDGGENWKKLTDTNGLPAGELGRIGVAISRSKSNILYALVEANTNALYKSIDGGENWSLVQSTNVGGRPFYYAELYVDPRNENRIYNIHSVVDISEDGGKTFRTLIPYYGIHPDHHAWWIHPENPDFIIDGNDGGLAISYNMGQTWKFIDNIPVAQFYHIEYDFEFPYNVYGGMQDNGSWVGPSQVSQHGGIRNSYWQELMFGDGFDVIPDKSDNRYAYAMWQEGNLGRVDKKTGDTKYIKPIHHDGVNLRFNWNSAIAHDKFDNKTIYFGSQFLHKSTDRGNNWEIISPDLTTNDSLKQKQDQSGGLTPDVTGAENHTTIITISQSKLNKNIIWVGTDDGNIQVTKDSGKTWTNTSANIKTVPQASWVCQVHASDYNENEVFAVMNNYRREDWTPYIIYSKDGGKTWKNIVANKIEGYALSFVQDAKEANLMFAGTELGLFVSFDKGENWQKWTENYPSVPTIDLKIHERDDDLIIGTFGRAAWIIDDIRPLRQIAKEQSTMKQKMKVFEAPKAVMAEYLQAPGGRFWGNGTYSGQNRWHAAMLSVLINKDTTKADTSKKQYIMSKDSIKIEIYNDRAEHIRTLKYKIEDGLNRLWWNLDRKSIRMPWQEKNETEDTEYSGLPIYPGVYKAVLTYQLTKDSQNIEVAFDPRINFDRSGFDTKMIAFQDFSKRIELSREIMDRIRESKKIIDVIEKQFSLQTDKDIKKKIDEQTKAIRDSIKTIEEFFSGAGGKKGIYRNPNNLQDNINDYTYILASHDRPNSNTDNILKLIDKQSKIFAEKWNKFNTVDWENYKKFIAEQKSTLFKDYDKIEWKE